MSARDPGSGVAAPLAFLIDYDGTIALTDVSDAIMAEHVPGDWEALAARYDAGRIGSRRLMDAEVALMPSDPSALIATAASQPHDPTFVPFVRAARDIGVIVEVVSDGFGFFIRPALERLGLGDLPVTTALTTFSPPGAPVISYPNGHPRCFVCGTCKRERVFAHRAAGRTVVFVGDGESDRYAAAVADVVFAKRSLVPICLANGWSFQRWSEFVEIETWLVETIARWRADPGSLPRRPDRPPFCGPEAWGEGLWDPPPGSNRT